MYKVKFNNQIIAQYIVGDADSYTKPRRVLTVNYFPRALFVVLRST